MSSLPLLAPIRILAIDGGGVGGIIPVRLLERLSTSYPGLLDRADLISGTSTGGLIALGLARGKTPAEMCQIYQDKCKDIFSSTHRRYRLQRLFKAKFNPTGLREAAEEIAGGLTLGDLTVKPVFIPVTALVRPDKDHQPAGVFLSTAYRLASDSGLEQHASSKWKCVDVALATSAAPTYFPAHKVTSPDPGCPGQWVCWDGGIVANNPALAAVGEMYRLYDAVHHPTANTLPDIRVLSLGTGYGSLNIGGGDWGLAQSAQPVVQGLLDASVGSTDFLIKQFLGNKIARINPVVKGADNYEMDDPMAVNRLNDFTEKFVEAGVTVSQKSHINRIPLDQWLRDYWFDELKPPQ